MVLRPALATSLALTLMAGCGGDGAREPPAAGQTAVTPTGTGAPPAPAPDAARGVIERGVVAYISDGDTIGVRIDGTVRRMRLLGIDAPETKDPDEPVGCYGPEAAARARALLPRGMTVTVVSDPTQDRIDRFGRRLVYVFRPRERRPVNEALVSDGAARVYVYRRERPFRRVAAFRRAESEARAARRGLWSRCTAP